jgi:hypothetical protein
MYIYVVGTERLKLTYREYSLQVTHKEMCKQGSSKSKNSVTDSFNWFLVTLSTITLHIRARVSVSRIYTNHSPHATVRSETLVRSKYWILLQQIQERLLCQRHSADERPSHKLLLQ